MNNQVLVVGGGASGLVAAGTAANFDKDVAILERNDRLAHKVLITGKGRCNLTNNCTVQEFISQVPRNGKFLYSCLSNFTPQDTMAFFEENGLSLKTERGNRVFPKSDKAKDVVDCLSKWVKNNNCRLIKNRAKELIIENNKCIGVKTYNNQLIYADSVLVCTGGLSYPKTGSTGDGYNLARQAGHSINTLRPSLVALESNDAWCKQLQGLTLKNCSVTVRDKILNKTVYSDFGELLFTHFGVSGPTILSSSVHMDNMEPRRYEIIIDLKPALDFEKLNNRILRDVESISNKTVLSLLRGLLPRSLCPVIAKLSKVDIDQKCNSLTRTQRYSIIDTLKHLIVNIENFRPIQEAVITSGGIEPNEINSTTMESKLVNSLYFAGEILDIDAYTGGFNLQIAFSTGRAAGLAMAEII